MTILFDTDIDEVEGDDNYQLTDLYEESVLEACGWELDEDED